MHLQFKRAHDYSHDTSPDFQSTFGAFVYEVVRKSRKACVEHDELTSEVLG